MKGPGFKRERVQYLNANHRDICKFDNPDDPNYLTLKNALTSATQNILKEGNIGLASHTTGHRCTNDKSQ